LEDEFASLRGGPTLPGSYGVPAFLSGIGFELAARFIVDSALPAYISQQDIENHPAFRAGRGATTIHNDVTSRLPAGYSLDLLSDPCIITLLRPDGTVAARFTFFADPEEVRQTAEEDQSASGSRQDD
jgi:hypothetical protein